MKKLILATMVSSVLIGCGGGSSNGGSNGSGIVTTKLTSTNIFSGVAVGTAGSVSSYSTDDSYSNKVIIDENGLSRKVESTFAYVDYETGEEVTSSCSIETPIEIKASIALSPDYRLAEVNDSEVSSTCEAYKITNFYVVNVNTGKAWKIDNGKYEIDSISRGEIRVQETNSPRNKSDMPFISAHYYGDESQDYAYFSVVLGVVLPLSSNANPKLIEIYQNNYISSPDDMGAFNGKYFFYNDRESGDVSRYFDLETGNMPHGGNIATKHSEFRTPFMFDSHGGQDGNMYLIDYGYGDNVDYLSISPSEIVENSVSSTFWDDKLSYQGTAMTFIKDGVKTIVSRNCDVMTFDNGVINEELGHDIETSYYGKYIRSLSGDKMYCANKLGVLGVDKTTLEYEFKSFSTPVNNDALDTMAISKKGIVTWQAKDRNIFTTVHGWFDFETGQEEFKEIMTSEGLEVTELQPIN